MSATLPNPVLVGLSDRVAAQQIALNELLGQLNDCAELVELVEQDSPQIAKLRAATLELAKAQSKLSAVTAAVAQTRALPPAQLTTNPAETDEGKSASGAASDKSASGAGPRPVMVDRYFSAKLAAAGKPSDAELRRSDKMMAFERAVWNVHHAGQPLPVGIAGGGGDDDDVDDEALVVGGASSETICPITKLPLVKPMVNAACGHVYSEAPIREMLGRLRPRETLPCPQGGCHARVSLASISPHAALERRMRRQAALGVAQPSAATQNVDDFEDIG